MMIYKNRKKLVTTILSGAILCNVVMLNANAEDHHPHGEENASVKHKIHSDEHKEDHHEEGRHEEDHHEEGHHEEGHHEEGHHEEGHIEITTENSLKAGIINGEASAGKIKNRVTVYGHSVIDASAISHVRARFSGLITKLNVNVGDEVKEGELIAEVESSNSLKHYNITAPISGVVTKRYANMGELATQEPLVTIENYDHLWGEYKIFPSQSHAIKKNQIVDVSSTHGQATSTIKHLLANKSQPFLTARVLLNNNDAKWVPGELLKGQIVTSEVDVNIAIDNRAFQEIEGKKVIFVTNKGGYETREISVGLTDGHFSEVLSGLELGEHYALINSYLLKADLGKAGASHSH
jgi:cobalt-zinc-cadmium efflux system membrane fusion protein